MAWCKSSKPLRNTEVNLRIQREMTVVHIGYKYGENNTGGAAIAATRLHKTLLSYGIESHYVCVWQCEDGKNVHVLPKNRSLVRKLYFLLTRLLRGMWKFTSWRQSVPLNVIPMFGLEGVLDSIKPDVVHVHWINADVMSFRQLSRLKYRTIINLHDLYMINIMKPHPEKDRRYIEGVASNNSTRLERWLFTRKMRAIRAICPTFIGPSKWVCECARQSIIGRTFCVYQIANIISRLYYYRPNLRTRHSKFRILFGAYSGRRNPAKGFRELEEALGLLPTYIKRQWELLVFGEMAQDGETGGVQTHFLGNLSSPENLMLIYHTADVYAFPSVAETLGMTKIEAMLCGLPVIAFDRTACAEGIEDGVSGWIVKDGDIKAFAERLVRQYEIFISTQSPDEIHRPVAQRAKASFDAALLLNKTIDVYQTLSMMDVKF